MMSEGDAGALRLLMEKATAVRESAYAPYSHFSVGAALLAEDGTVYVGCNVENASYGLGICAERSAAVSAVAAGRRTFRAIAIAGPPTTATLPCGACRQFLSEFAPHLVVVYTTEGDAEQTTLDQLLPRAFGPLSLQ